MSTAGGAYQDGTGPREGGHAGITIALPAHHPLYPGDLADMSPLRHSLSRPERRQSSINVLGFDLYDAVEVEQKGWRGAKEWVPGTIVQVNAHNNTFDVKVLKPNQEGEVLENVSPVRMRRIAESRHPHQQKGRDSPQLGPVPGDSPTHGGQDFLKQRHLGAADACEIMDEFNFQMQASLFTSKVLKQLDSVPESDLMAVSPCVKSLAHVRERTRSRVESGEGPLLDRFFFQCDTDAAAGQASTFPTSAQVMKMLESITDFHANCPFTNSGGVADVAMGTNCIVADRHCEEICSPEAMVRLLDKMYELLEMEAPTALISVTVPADGRLVVVGDTHGQLEDVLWMLFKHGVPNRNNVYLFNGDIADRGGHALEIFTLLFLFKLLCPQSVYILRGNHEDDYCNLNYGFLAELRHKFGQVEGGRMHKDFLRVFYSLPLSCVIDSWDGYYRCQQTHMLVQLKVGSSPVAVTDVPGQHRRVVPVVLRECSGEDTSDSSSSDDDADLSAENGWYQGGVSEERLVFDKRVGVRGLNENGDTEIKWSSGDIWTYVSPRLIVLHGGLPMHPGSGSPISTQRPTGAFASLFSGSSAMGSQAGGSSSSQDDDGRRCVLLKYFHQLPNRMRIPSSPQGVFEQWMYQILWSDPREVGDTKGRGTPFYPDDTELFCDRNNIHTVIRSHQLPAMQRGFSFHHKHKLITIFSASNYCGTSQNYGGLLIFTTELFPEIQYSRNLFEHWSPPLSVIQDVYSKHKNASQDVRQYIARETESARMPTDMNSSTKWLHIEEKVSEYAMSLIVQNKRHLWTNLWTRDEDKTMRVDLADWEDACAQVVGHQFPWRTLFVQLDIEEEDDGTVDYLDFLNRFRASLRDESGPFDSWLASVVLGFFMDILNADMAIQQDLLTGEPGENLINYEQFERSLRDNCPDLTITHIQLVWQALIECSTPERRRAGLVDARQFVCACGEFYRARWDLHEPVFSTAQTLPSANEEEMLEKIMDFLPRLRDSIEQKYDNDTQRFFEEKIEDPAKKKIPGAVSNEDFVNALTAELPSLGITELPSRNFLELTARMMESSSATSNGHPAGRGARLVSSTNSGYVSLFRFMATLHVDGTEAGRVMAQKIMEHSCAATYFHRNAFKCACARLDPQNCGEISKRNFRKAFTALNQALDPEWRLTKLQIDAALDHFDWTVDADEEFTDASSSDQDMKSVDEEPPAGQARRPTLGALSASNTNSALEMLRGELRCSLSRSLVELEKGRVFTYAGDSPLP
ncbi:protein phosphatase, EF-hand calcium binding domain [Perkinsus olseni]|uniref:Serine/threonine-protein phosphatase n=1 Tax=Perkinsus olseni TaxID=32597 RepID=A0A7J6MIR6_PEROL|nr:protein phosphatase, EF-hand calcium binding domain [Perkinsus olseni]KAF4675266.1 protein phosphatase, EF-hand calcium binding domain [Perkinsus olseni]